MVKALEQKPTVKVTLQGLSSGMSLYNYFYRAEQVLHQQKPDIAVIPCDRCEMAPVALAAFQSNHVMAAFHAGDLGCGVQDEVYRVIINRCAHILFCETPESAETLKRLGEEAWRIHVVGSTAFDYITSDYSQCPKESYDLLLVNPDTYSEENTVDDINYALSLIDKFTIIVEPNFDLYYERIIESINDYAQSHENIMVRPHFPRPIFLGLMEKCTRFITNSSSSIFESPFLGVKVVHIGQRNRDRKPPSKLLKGGADKIADILATIEINDKLRRKKLHL